MPSLVFSLKCLLQMLILNRWLCFVIEWFEYAFNRCCEHFSLQENHLLLSQRLTWYFLSETLAIRLSSYSLALPVHFFCFWCPAVQLFHAKILHFYLQRSDKNYTRALPVMISIASCQLCLPPCLVSKAAAFILLGKKFCHRNICYQIWNLFPFNLSN